MPIRMHVPLAPGTTTLSLGGQMMGVSPMTVPIDPEAEAIAQYFALLRRALGRGEPTVMDEVKTVGKAAVGKVVDKTTNNLSKFGPPPFGPSHDKDTSPPNLHQVLLQRRLAAMGEHNPRPSSIGSDGPDWKRPDGSQKGQGFLGALPTQGGLMTEYSIEDDAHQPNPLVGGDYPSIVPTLDASELNQILNQHVPDSARDKALQFALARQKAGQSVFAQPGEQNPNILPMFNRIP